MLLPFNKSKESKSSGKNTIVLAGDIGATKTNLALFNVEEDHVTPLQEAQYKSHDYENIIDLTDAFIRDLPLPVSICFGVAGPVLNGHAKLSNINWDINSAELCNHFKVKNVQLINDLEATAYGLAVLNEIDVVMLHKGSDDAVGNAAVIAPGTGLGEAGLYWDGNY